MSSKAMKNDCLSRSLGAQLLFSLVVLASFGQTIYAQSLFGFTESAVVSFPKLQIYAEFNKTETAPHTKVTLIVHVSLQSGWHIYSLVTANSEGPLPTELVMQSSWLRSLGNPKESSPFVLFDEAFQQELAVHKEQFTFYQDLQIAKNISLGPQDLQGQLRYQICNNRICAPLQTVDFMAPLTISSAK